MSTKDECESCGRPVPADAPAGICPACVAAAALDTETEVASGGGSGPREPFQAPAPEVLDALIPTVDVEELIGRGGMGAVYKGRQPGLDRAVAVKLLPTELTAHDPAFAERFRYLGIPPSVFNVLPPCCGVAVKPFRQAFLLNVGQFTSQVTID